MTVPLNERIEDEGQNIEQSITSRLAQVWTAIPAIVQSFDPETITCVCQPAVQARIRNPDGSVQLVNLPLLLDCPVVFPHAGGASVTFPIKADDEVLIVFSSRAIDFWWQNGGVQPPPEIRMHDLSDGFVILGVWSQPKKIRNISTSSWQIRSDDKSAYLELNVTTKDINLVTNGNVTADIGKNLSAHITGTATIKADGGTTITSPTVTINGNLILNGSMKSNAGSTGDKGFTITGDVVADNISLKSHVHGGVQSGSSNTSTPR